MMFTRWREIRGLIQKTWALEASINFGVLSFCVSMCSLLQLQASHVAHQIWALFYNILEMYFTQKLSNSLQGLFNLVSTSTNSSCSKEYPSPLPPTRDTHKHRHAPQIIRIYKPFREANECMQSFEPIRIIGNSDNCLEVKKH